MQYRNSGKPQKGDIVRVAVGPKDNDEDWWPSDKGFLFDNRCKFMVVTNLLREGELLQVETLSTGEFDKDQWYVAERFNYVDSITRTPFNYVDSDTAKLDFNSTTSRLVPEADEQHLDAIFKECQEIKKGRGKVYGGFRDDYRRVSRLFEERTGIHVSEREALIFMQCVKWSRLCVSPFHRDSHVDLLNYIAFEQAITDTDEKPTS
jgi:hypothetical protein